MCIRTIEELEKDTREKQVIDIRDKADFEKETYPGAVNIYWEELEEHMDEIRRDCPVYLVCYTGQKSEEIAEELTEQGYEIYSVKNGYRAWLKLKLGRLMANHNEAEQRTKDIERSIIKKFRKPIWRRFTKAIREYELVQDGDKIAVCISGGKDSMLMAKLLQELQKYSEVPFELVYLVMDPGYNELNRKKIESNAELLHIPITIFETDIFSVANNTEKNPCYLCAKMRRGHLYSKAKSLGCNKIALGHHFSDVVETTVMSMFYGAQLQAMPPKLHSQNFEGMELIRPMYCIHEDDILSWKRYNDLEFIQCACRFTENCATCDNDVSVSKRQETKLLLRRLKRDNPNIEKSIFNSIHSVCLDTMVGYKSRGVTHTFTEIYNTRTEELKEKSIEDE
ncbi:ATP-binding protein [Hominenteromicrobium sp.]|uniref:ATP-binding protein n=1 Tax=Hominenteromicrobium sp. TaxID=3073581 RepID=UPI003AB1DFEE